jgi:hypothetical protein
MSSPSDDKWAPCYPLMATSFGLRAPPTGGPFASTGPKNASGSISSEATDNDRAVRGDANLAQICTRFASPRTLRGRGSVRVWCIRDRSAVTR